MKPHFHKQTYIFEKVPILKNTWNISKVISLPKQKLIVTAIMFKKCPYSRLALIITVP